MSRMLVSIRESLAFAGCYTWRSHSSCCERLRAGWNWGLGNHDLWIEFKEPIGVVQACSKNFKELPSLSFSFLLHLFAAFLSRTWLKHKQSHYWNAWGLVMLGHAWSTVQYYPVLSSTCISKMFKANFMLTTHIDSPHVTKWHVASGLHLSPSTGIGGDLRLPRSFGHVKKHCARTST